MRPTILLADDCEMLGVAIGEVIADRQPSGEGEGRQ
jgi:hypothetical protein